MLEGLICSQAQLRWSVKDAERYQKGHWFQHSNVHDDRYCRVIVSHARQCRVWKRQYWQTISSMLGNRTPTFQTDHICFVKRHKKENVCRGCGESGHWCKDGKECSEEFMSRRRQARRIRSNATRMFEDPPSSAKKEEVPTQPSSINMSLFPQWGPVSSRLMSHPLLNQGAPNSTSSLGIALQLNHPKTHYVYGWVILEPILGPL